MAFLFQPADRPLDLARPPGPVSDDPVAERLHAAVAACASAALDNVRFYEIRVGAVMAELSRALGDGATPVPQGGETA